jgi:low temperature requirement protein LtrA
MQSSKYNIWWGPPRKFIPKIDERRISWLELFYDLVYVIAIARATHHFAAHPGFSGLFDYAYLFIMIFWGWLNGSLYHDLHGSPGIRTRFMTLWQMVTIAALVVCLSSEAGILVFRTTIALIVVQVFITYLWWSVGIYDKAHRVYNKPYTICYLVAAALLGMTLLPDFAYSKFVFWTVLILNYLPPFIVIPKLRKDNTDFSLSSNMVERLGLFTIIVFGECVLGIINGTVPYSSYGADLWLNFLLGVLIVFALWWVFFSLIADRECYPGFLNANFIELSYIPTLGSLGIIGASFPGLFAAIETPDASQVFIAKAFFGGGLACFLCGITLITYFLHYPPEFDPVKKKVRLFLLSASLILVLLIFIPNQSLTIYLGLVFSILLCIIILLTRIWFVLQLKMIEADEN